MSPFAESAAAVSGVKLAAWGVATGVSAAALAGDTLSAMAINPTDVANRITVIGGAFLGLIGLGLGMWRDHLKKLQDINRGSMADQIDVLTRRNAYLEERDRDQDETNTKQGQLIGSQNFELGKLRERIADLHRQNGEKDAAIAKKDQMIESLAIGNLIAKGYLTPASLVVTSSPLAGQETKDGASPSDSGSMRVVSLGVVTPEMVDAAAQAAAQDPLSPTEGPPGTTTTRSGTVSVTTEVTA